MLSYTKQYLSQLCFFLGIGLIGGAVVHLTRDPLLYGTIGIVGVVLFIGGSLLQSHIDGQAFSRKALLFTVLFALGIGVASGGIQHFLEVGNLGPIFIAGGLALSFIVFGYKVNHPDLSTSSVNIWLTGFGILIVTLLLSGGIFLGLQGGMSMMDGHGHDEGRGMNTDQGDHGMDMGRENDMGDDHTNSMDHGAMITDAYSFVALMIPHHQEAVDTATIISRQTQNPELKTLTQDIIIAQEGEISQMKVWLTTYRPERSESLMYEPMMNPSLASMNVADADKSFVTDMIVHHQGAVDMAMAVLRLDDVPDDVREMAYAVIATQSEEIVRMDKILRTLP